ncbi:MAG: imidazole glycerol phosphate synthase subunit HisH [Acidimicrobiales bacterium]
MKPFVAVVDYGIGNLRSAEKALCRAGADARLVTSAADIDRADGVVLPGVGNFGECREALADSGMWEATLSALRSGRPFFGICVGMQLLYEGSDESPGAEGFGVFAGKVALLPAGVRRPQMQWNVLTLRDDVVGASGPTVLLHGYEVGAWVYFVHSYSAPIGPETVATCEYGGPVAAAVEAGSIWATQFHPEKSSTVGLGILGNFVARCAGG